MFSVALPVFVRLAVSVELLPTFTFPNASATG
jgi:hypothetical protein